MEKLKVFSIIWSILAIFIFFLFSLFLSTARRRLLLDVANLCLLFPDFMNICLWWSSFCSYVWRSPPVPPSLLAVCYTREMLYFPRNKLLFLVGLLAYSQTPIIYIRIRSLKLTSNLKMASKFKSRYLDAIIFPPSKSVVQWPTYHQT